MTSMRERMHVVLWALLVMFILSMTIGGMVGGANILDTIFGRVNPAEAIGVVDGEIIPPDDFIRAVNLRAEQYRNNGRETDERLLYTIRNEVWDNYIRDILLYKQIDKLDLVVSDEEVIYHLKNNPPPFLIQDPSFHTDGVFDQGKYAQAVNNPVGNEWVEIEHFMKNTYIPNYKLQQYIASSVVVTHDEVKEKYIKDNVNYTVEGIHVVARKLQDEVSNPTDDELYQYYIDHIDDFTKDETRNIRYVKWAKESAARDSIRVFEEAQELIEKVKNNSDFASLADLFTDDPSNQVTPDSGRGGSLGWFGKGQMLPSFEEAAFSAKVGDVVGPVLTRFGYHIIKINEKRFNDYKEEVNAAHILLNITMGSQTREELRRQATHFSYDAQDYGFDAALDTHKVEARKAQNLTAMAISVPGIGFMRDVVKFAFNDLNKIGSISDRLENDTFFVIAVLDTISPKGNQPYNLVKNNIQRIVLAEKQKSAANNLASEIRKNVDDGLSIIDIVSDDSRLELVATDKKTLSRGFNSIGRSYKLIGTLLDSEVGEIIGPVETARGYAIIKLLSVTPFDSTDFQNESADIYTKLTNEAQQNAFDYWLSELRENADIVDNRKYFY